MALTQSQLAAVQASMTDPRYANASFAQNNPKNAFYKQVADYRSSHTAEETANAFANNPFGVSFQELLVTSPSTQPADTGMVNTSGLTGGAPQVSLADKINALNDMYNLLYQDLGTMTQEQRGKIEQGFGQQAKSQQTAYEQTARALPLQYGAMGVGDSSYYAKAAGTASDMYNQAIQQIQQEKEKSLADLGKLYQQQMVGLQSAQAQLGSLPKYGTQAEASQLESQLGSLAQQRAGLGTQAGYLGQLNQIAPNPGTTTAKLQEQLSNLSTSSIPSFAKQTIASGQIKQSGLSPDQQQYYTDYFQKLQQQQGTPSVGA